MAVIVEGTRIRDNSNQRQTLYDQSAAPRAVLYKNLLPPLTAACNALPQPGTKKVSTGIHLAQLLGYW